MANLLTEEVDLEGRKMALAHFGSNYPSRVRACPMVVAGLGPRLAQARVWTRLEYRRGAGIGWHLPMAKALGSPGRLHDCRGPRFSPILNDSLFGCTSCFCLIFGPQQPWQGIQSFTRPVVGTRSKQGNRGQRQFCKGDCKLKRHLMDPLAPFIKNPTWFRCHWACS